MNALKLKLTCFLSSSFFFPLENKESSPINISENFFRNKKLIHKKILISLFNQFPGESVAKSCSKFVLVVWLILAFVLMQSYTANLSAILTLDQLQPSYPSVGDLRRNGENIGYPTGSYLSDMLVDKMKFDKSKLKDISNMKDYHKALDKGTRNGGVAAIFDEIPYIKMFLKKYGSKYMMVETGYRTDGLGFVNFDLPSSLSLLINVSFNLCEIIY